MSNLPKSVPPTPTPRRFPHQLSIPFNSIHLPALNPLERAKATACLAILLMQAAGVATGERNDDEC